MKMNSPLSIQARRALNTLAHDIVVARKLRHLTQQQLADAASVSVSTIKRLEKADGGVSIGALSMVLLVLGLIK